MKQKEFKWWLEEQGVVVKNAKGHWKAYYNGKQTTLPRHPSHEIGEGLRQRILKQLGLK